MDGTSKTPETFFVAWSWYCFSIALLFSACQTAHAQQPLRGEFTDIQVGRELMGRDNFPTIQELRELAREPQCQSVVTIVIRSGKENLHLPQFSCDGRRLAFQQSLIGVNSSKLWLFESLSQETPRLLTEQPDDYDHMFTWSQSNAARNNMPQDNAARNSVARNSASSFTFVRIQGSQRKSQLFYSSEDSKPEPITATEGISHPALFESPDGSHWIAAERRGDLVQLIWKGSSNQVRALGRGTSPQWSADGKFLLLARVKKGSGAVVQYQPALHEITSERDQLVAVPDGALIRSPTLSPNGTQIAWLEREAGDRSPWRIRATNTDGIIGAQFRGKSRPPGNPAGDVPTTIMDDVVVNEDFKPLGPCWDPLGTRIWCFSTRYSRNRYTPFIAVSVENQLVTEIDYSNEISSPTDLQLSPSLSIPEVSFIGHRGNFTQLYVTLVNHY